LKAIDSESASGCDCVVCDCTGSIVQTPGIDVAAVRAETHPLVREQLGATPGVVGLEAAVRRPAIGHDEQPGVGATPPTVLERLHVQGVLRQPHRMWHHLCQKATTRVRKLGCETPRPRQTERRQIITAHPGESRGQGCLGTPVHVRRPAVTRLHTCRQMPPTPDAANHPALNRATWEVTATRRRQCARTESPSQNARQRQ
jgi:hypothetical protein